MLHEYAVDPQVLADLPRLQRVADAFGMGTGRLVAKYPSKYCSEVYECCKDRMRPVELSRAEVLLARLKHKVWKNANGRDYVKMSSWLESAEDAHGRQPFQAIVALTNPRHLDSVIDWMSLDETHELWRIPHDCSCARDARLMVARLLPVALNASRLVFVDPFFAPEYGDYQDVFYPLLDQLRKRASVLPRIEVLLSYEKSLVDRSNKKKLDYDFADECGRRQKYILPKGMTVECVRISKMPGCDRVHDRFLLTDRGGLSVTGGFNSGVPGETVLMSLLSDDTYGQLWPQYSEPSQHFEVVDITRLSMPDSA